MASNVEVNLIARTSDFEDKMTKATKTFEALAFKGTDSNKALSKSFEQLNKIASSELSDLQKAFNSLQIKGDFGIGIQKEKIAEAKRFYIQQFNEIKNSAETSAAETARAWAGLKNAFSNINNASGTGSTGTSDFKVMMQAQQEANAMNDKFNDMRLRSDAKTYEEALVLNQKFNYDKAKSELRMLEEANLINSKFNYDKLQSQIKMQEEANLLNQKFNQDKLRSEAAMLQEARILNQKFDYERMQSAAKLAAAKVLADQEALTKINIAHEQALRMDKERDAQMAVSREQALRKMTLAHSEANAMNAKFNAGLGGSSEQINKMGDATERVHNGINGWSLASVAAIAKIQILYSVINNIMGTIAQFPGRAIAAVEDYKSSIISNAAIITSMQAGVKDVGVQYQKNKVYAEGVQQTLIKMDANTAANIKNLGDMNNQFVQQGVLIDVNNEKQKKGFLNIANYLATITANDPNKDMQYGQELRSMKDFSTRAGNRLVQYLETQGVTKEMLDGWKEFGRVTENNGYLLEKLAPYFKGFEAAQNDINGLLATAKSTLTTIYTEVLRGGLTPAVDALNKKMNELVGWAVKHKEEISQGLYRGWLEVKGVIESVYLALKLIKAPIDLINTATKPLGFGVHSIFEGWSLIGAVALPTVMEKLLQVAKVAEGISKYNLLGGLFGDKETKTQIKLDRNQLQKDMAAVTNMSGFDTRMADWNVKFKPSNVTGENPTGVGGKGGEKGKASHENENALDNAYLAYSKAFDEREAEASISANKRLLEINEQGYSDGKVALKDYLSIRENLIEANLKFEIVAKQSELAEAKKLDAGKIISKTDAKGKTVVDQDAMLVQHFNALTKIENAKKALAVAEDKLNVAKAVGIKFDEKTEDVIRKSANSAIGLVQDLGAKSEQSPLERALEAIRKKVDALKVAFSELKPEALILFKKQTGLTGVEDIESVGNNAEDRLKLDDLKKNQAAANKLAYGMDKSIANNKKPLGFFDQGQAEKAAAISAADERLLARETEIFNMGELDAVEVESNRKKWALMAKAQQEYDAATKRLTEVNGTAVMSIVSQNLSSVSSMLAKGNKEQFEQSKAFAIAAATINAYMAASSAYAAGVKAGGAFGVALGTVSAGIAVAQGLMQVAQISSQTYEAREFGGPVTAGQSYIVGEKRPELFTPGSNGVITPYVPSEGRGETSYAPTFNIDARNSTLGASDIKSIVQQAVETSKAAILNSMNRGGEFAVASGRVK